VQEESKRFQRRIIDSQRQFVTDVMTMDVRKSPVKVA